MATKKKKKKKDVKKAKKAARKTTKKTAKKTAGKKKAGKKAGAKKAAGSAKKAAQRPSTETPVAPIATLPLDEFDADPDALATEDEEELEADLADEEDLGERLDLEKPNEEDEGEW